MKLSRLAAVSTALLLALAVSGAAAAADPPEAPASGGKAAFNNHCRTCHSPKPGDNRLGPALGGIVGAKAGTRPGYSNYSQAMKTAGITWDELTLDRFIANPEEVVPNNNMKPYKGLPDAAVRKSITEYLKSEKG